TAFIPASVLSLDHLKWRIQCIDSWGRRIIVGGNDGSLRIFDSDDEKVVWRQLFCDENFAKKTAPLEQISVVSHDNRTLLISLADSLISVHELPPLPPPPPPSAASTPPKDAPVTLMLRCRLEKSRGAYLFASNKD